ncbi:MAG TPA: hypothetical protein VHF91_02880, partial [Acidimicrobiales bacterium]|nr:hypothetical protein [Acidimicrobiales bacterium]
VDDDGDDGRTAAAIGQAPATTSTLPPLITSTSALPAETTTTASRRTSTTTVRRTGGTTATTAPRTTTPTTTARPLCAASQIELTASTNNSRATSGQPVTLTSTIRNKSTFPCFYTGYEFRTEFRDPLGAPLVGSVIHADAVEPAPFNPGQSLSHSATWDPQACQQSPCPAPGAGIYSATATWSFSGGTYRAMQQFVVS